MTRMERLADWLADLITGGELSFRKSGWDRSNALYTEAKRDAADYLAWGNERHADYLRLEDALRTIAAMETPGAAPAAKRMAKVAEEALEK